jgi:hypothetical protein
MASMTKELRARITLRLLAVKGRGETLERLHRSIESEIADSIKRIDRAGAGNDDYAEAVSEEECLAIEELLGLAFVAAQSFINAIRTELVAVASVYTYDFGKALSFAPDPKLDALKLSPTFALTNVSIVETINAVANYWKHSEEWPLGEETAGGRIRTIWNTSSLKGIQKTSVAIAINLGLEPNSSGNMRTAATALGMVEYDDLSPIRQVLTDWAAVLLEKSRAEFGVKDIG